MSIFNIASWFKRPFWLSETGNYSGPSDTYSGKLVTPETALSLSTVWACVRLISESIALLPCGLYYRDEDGQKQEASDHELSKILRESPNADMTPMDFWQLHYAYKMLWGNAYHRKNYRGTGSGKKLVSLDPLRPDWMSIRVNEDLSFTYVYSDPLGRRIEYSEDEIWHAKGFSLNGRIGVSVITFARNSFASAMALEESAGRLYSNGMRPGGALTFDKVLDKAQREQVRAAIADQIGGVARSGGTIILEAGMKYEPLSIPPEDAQMLQSRSFSVEEVCRWFGVPPSLIGHTEKTTTWGTGLEQINLGFLTYTLQPWIKRAEQSIRHRLISAAERTRLFAEFNIEGFLRADSAGRAAYYNSATQNGWMTRAEIRRKENLPFIAGSDQLTVQSALVPLEMLGQAGANSSVEDTGKV